MEVFTEIVCDSQSDMNAFAPEDQADMAGFMREIKRIAQEEKAQIQGRAPPVVENVSFSRNRYWIPKLTQQERSRVEYLINNNKGTKLTSNCCFFFDNSKGNILFGIYSTDDDTLLYASKGEKAEKENASVKMIVEEYDNANVVDTSSKGLDSLLKGIRMQQTANSSDSSGVAVSARIAGDGRVYGEKLGCYTSSALQNVLSNLFSAETGRRTGERAVKASREAVDSQGRELSEGQLEYFKDSKVRDQQGRLLVMYRGDQEEFTVFDRKKSSYSNLYGRGFYFTNSTSHAGQYGTAKPFYLNITNPVSTTEQTITKDQMWKFLEAVADNADDFSFENYGYGATVDSVLKTVYSGRLPAAQSLPRAA